MLSAKELLKYKTKPTPSVYSLGAKEIDEVSPEFDTSQLEAKLNNIEELLGLERVRMNGQLSRACWCQDKGMAEVTEKVGPHWDYLGHTEHAKCYLYPEEALFLVDIGGLELTFNEVPLSLQRAFFLLTNTTDLSLEKYRVFSQLSLLGYKVMRHCEKNVLTSYEQNIGIHKLGIKHRDVTMPETECRVRESCAKKTEVESDISTADSVILPLQCERGDSTASILKRLQSAGPGKESCFGADGCIVDFDVFLPGNDGTPFRKSTIQMPSLRVRVFASTDDAPDLIELCKQRNYFEDKVPLIHAIVYPDFISFLQIASVDIPNVVT